jgi:hypothetical protein
VAKHTRLAVRYGGVEASPARPALSVPKILVLVGMLVIGVTGGLVWLRAISVEKQGAAHRVVRKQRAPAPPAEEAPAEPATTRANGRLVG